MTDRARAIVAFVEETADQAIAFRRELHAHPELSWQEGETTARIRRELDAAGLEPAALPTDTGLQVDVVTGPKDARGQGPTVALRADIDGLPLNDEKEVPYRSTVEGVCHACGHDVHTAAAVAAARCLGELADQLAPGRVRVIFQPAEEAIPGGAYGLHQTSVLDGVAAIYALHCDPSLDVGQLGVRVGPITSAADRLIIRLSGPGGHTARPHLTVDLLEVAGRVLTGLPAGIAKLTDVRDSATLVFGSIRAGHAPNVIPTEAEIRGTLRVRGRATWDAAPEVIERLLQSVVEPYGAEADLRHDRGSPPVVNDERATAVLSGAAVDVLGAESVVATEQSVGNEDFSWFLERVPGSYARLGVRPPGQAGRVDLHAGGFDVDERAIAIGAKVMALTASRALEEY